MVTLTLTALNSGHSLIKVKPSGRRANPCLRCLRQSDIGQQAIVRCETAARMNLTLYQLECPFHFTLS